MLTILNPRGPLAVSLISWKSYCLAAQGDTMVKGVQSVVDNSGRTTAVRIAWPRTDWRVLQLKQELRG